MRQIYVDNGSSSFPKAPGVSNVMKDFLDESSVNVNRGGYTASYDIAMQIVETRQLLACLFGSQHPQEVVFTPGATYALNMILQGFLKKGDHVITTSMEHNAVMRPLHMLSKIGVTYDVVPCCQDGTLQADEIIPFIKEDTKAVVMSHASNVCGTILPIDHVSDICQKHQIRLIVDAAQTAGVLDICAKGIDALIFAGHKGLLGPGGVGGFVIKQAFADEITPLIVGGTGSTSHELEQPDFLPDKFESGTLNISGILGLKKAIEFINSIGVTSIYQKEMLLVSEFLLQLHQISGVNIIGKRNAENRVAVVSVDFPNHDNAEIASVLDNEYGIMTRCGLHCAPYAHKTLNTYPQGTVRISFGYFNTMDDVTYIVQSIKDILEAGGRDGV